MRRCTYCMHDSSWKLLIWLVEPGLGCLRVQRVSLHMYIMLECSWTMIVENYWCGWCAEPVVLRGQHVSLHVLHERQ